MEGSVPNSALPALEAEGDRDGAAEFFRVRFPSRIEPGVRIVKLELPGAVQVLPRFPFELRLRKFGARRLRGRKGGEHRREQGNNDAHEVPIVALPAARIASLPNRGRNLIYRMTPVGRAGGQR